MQINQDLYRIYRRLQADDFFCFFHESIMSFTMNFTKYTYHLMFENLYISCMDINYS